MAPLLTLVISEFNRGLFGAGAIRFEAVAALTFDAVLAVVFV